MGQNGFALATLETCVNYLIHLDININIDDSLSTKPESEKVNNNNNNNNAETLAVPEIPPTQMTADNVKSFRKVFKEENHNEVIVNRYSCVYPNLPNSK